MTRTITIVQVSDTHLSETHAYFIDNFAVFADEMAEIRPDLIVHTGDVSFNGPARPADLQFASQQLKTLGIPVLALAGNHDIGEAPRHSRLKQPINDERIRAWTDAFGPMFWQHDLPDWRLIGLDTALMGSDREEERQQLEFLEESLASRGPRKAMVFMHMPPFENEPDDPRPTTSCVPHDARAGLLYRLERGGVSVVACGHLHVYRQLTYRGIEIVWAPTTAMVNIEKQFRHWEVWTRPGYLIWRFKGEQVSHELVEPRLMIGLDTSRWTEIGGTTTNMPPRPLRRFC
ncbi:MAG: metallophosphoesterase [Microcystis sp. LE19-4.1E]|jgi:3',5'-cyclic AMP phosphodiesterase CpdA|nr:metallophosphoesterase [Microcystis sp. LE19-4.1E]